MLHEEPRPPLECPTCDGAGYLPCACGGRDDCDACNGHGRTDCHDCDNTGEWRCRVCGMGSDFGHRKCRGRHEW